MKKKIISAVLAAACAASALAALTALSGCSSKDTYVEYTLYNGSDEVVSTYHVSADPTQESTDEYGAVVAAEYDFTIEGADSSYYFTVTGYSGKPKDVVIPATYGGVDVTGIGEEAFESSSVSSVIMSDNITTLGDLIFFNCGSLKSVTLSSSLTEIPWGTFAWCYSLTEIEIPAGVTSIGTYAFRDDDNLTAVTFEDGSQLNYIGIAAFYGCELLPSISIPSTVQTIDEGAFYACYALESVVFADNCSLQAINYQAFAGCMALTEINFGADSQLKTIGEEAFYYCNTLTSITIPSEVTYIGANAFSTCSALTSVTIETAFDSGSVKYCYLYTKSLTDIEDTLELEEGALSAGDSKAGDYLYNYTYSGFTTLTGQIPAAGFTDAEQNATLLTSTLVSAYWYFVPAA